MPTKDDNDAATNSPSFMDLFAIHLAARLVGREKMLNLFDVVPSAKPSPLNRPIRVGYWKTPLLLDCNTCLASSGSADATDNDWNVVFLDVTITFDVWKKAMTTTVGMMLLREHEQECVYITAEPMSFSQLAKHSETIGIAIADTLPGAIAHIMGGAFMGIITGNNTVKLQRSDGTFVTTAQDLVASAAETKVSLPLRLHYKDLQETGTLELMMDEVDSFNSKSVAMMMESLRRVDELEAAAAANVDVATTNVEAVHDPQAAAVLTKAYESWLNVLKRAAEESARASLQSSVKEATIDAAVNGAENVANGVDQSSALPSSKTGESSIPTESTTSASEVPDAKAAAPKEEEPKKQSQPPVKRPQAGYVCVPNPKRKRRGKLTFSKASK